MITIKGHLQVRFLPLGSFRLKKSSFVAKFGGGKWGLNVYLRFIAPKKHTFG